MRPVRVVTKPVRLISNESTLRDGDTHEPRTRHHKRADTPKWLFQECGEWATLDQEMYEAVEYCGGSQYPRELAHSQKFSHLITP